MIKQSIITALLLLTAVNGWAQKVWTNSSYRNEPQGFQFDVKEVEFCNDETVLHRSPEKSWKNVIAEYDLTAPNCVHYNLPDDQQHAVEQYIGLTGYPTYRLFDKQGGIHHLNWLDDENLSEFKKKLDELDK